MNLSSEVAVFWWRPACWLRVSGPDSATFLQGQFTNDLRDLAPGRAVYGLWLTVKGKVVGDSFVARGPADTDYWVGSYHSPATTIRERLESHIIADDVTIEDETSLWSAVTIWGESTHPLVSEVQRSALGRQDQVVFPGRRGSAGHAEWAFRSTDDSDVSARLAGARVLGESEMERRRIESAIPAIPVDIGPDDLPNEGGLDVAAISYTKGCYLGQEVMARLKSMGQVRRRLISVTGNRQTPPTPPVAVFAGARQVGEVRSVVAREDGSIVGLAMLSLLHVKPDTALSFSAGGAPALQPLAFP